MLIALVCAQACLVMSKLNLAPGCLGLEGALQSMPTPRKVVCFITGESTDCFSPTMRVPRVKPRVVP